MQLTVRHITRYDYQPEAAAVALRLKLFPAASDAQTTGDWGVTVNGDQVTPLLTDAPGDRIGLWHSDGPVAALEIEAGGTVETHDTAGVLRGLAQNTPSAVYLRRTTLTRPSKEIHTMAEAIEDEDQLTRLHALSAAVHERVRYQSGTTDAATTAAEAILAGEGVCQDQAHVFIAAARVMGIPARYVTGYLHDPDAGEAAEQTHAWAEAHVPGLGWVGFDVTHLLCPTEAYVRLASGFDADDAAPVRGTVTGTQEEVLATSVTVAVAGSQAQQ